MLTEKEKELIFEYNRRITDALQPYLTGEENKWLETLNEKHSTKNFKIVGRTAAKGCHCENIVLWTGNYFS